MQKILVIALLAMALATTCDAFAKPYHFPWSLDTTTTTLPESVRVTLMLTIPETAQKELEKTVLAGADPASPDYGRELAIDEVGDMVASPFLDAWLAFLDTHGVTDVMTCRTRDCVRFEASPAVVARMFRTRLARFTRTTVSGQRLSLVRAVEGAYTLPAHLEGSVAYAVGLEDFAVAKPRVAKTAVGLADTVTPSVVHDHYDIGSTTGKVASNNMAVAEFEGELFSASDLATFQQTFGLAQDPIAKLVGTNVNGSGTESNLDIQYITATAQGVPAWFVYGSQGSTFAEEILDWTTMLKAMDRPPYVNSVSYGLPNHDTPDSLKQRIDAEFQQLLAVRSTIIFSSGDHGVQCELPWLVESPQYPAVSPWVLAVGATYLDGSHEVCASLSGGGFAHAEDMPAWQKTAVSSYLSTVHKPPSHEYNPAMRAVPDVSAFGEDVIIVVGGAKTPVAGTSCSAPMWGGVIALVNDARMDAGKTALGFVNPLIYSIGANATAYASAFNDVTSGKNSDGLCEGWEAQQGWDACSGWGSPRLTGLVAAALALPGTLSQ